MEDMFARMPRTDLANAELDTMVAIEENHHEKTKDNIFITQRGVKLHLQKVNAFLIAEAVGKVKFPDVPVVHIEEDDRDEENPNDPVYIAKLQDANVLRNSTSYNVSIAMGTYCERGWVPDGIDYVDGTKWPELMEYAGVDVPDKRLARYVAWVKYYVLVDHDELNELVTAILTYGGILQEKEVQEAIETFPDTTERSSDNGTPDTE